MPPKRKTVEGGAGGKKSKAAPATMKDASEALKAADEKKGGKKSHYPDLHCPLCDPDFITGEDVHVVDDYDCMLNQTNIGHNNNKFYVLQVLQTETEYYAWNRWGRVGESGDHTLKGPMDLESAVKLFEKKFLDKTKNKWADRDSFTPKKGKYTLIEMADEDEVDTAAPPVASTSMEGKKVAECSLDKETQRLIQLIFDEDVFQYTMKKFDIDVKKMPLGKVSKSQIAKGFDILDEIEKALSAKATARLKALSSSFYTVIPHDFGRRPPPVIKDLNTLRSKMNMLLVLGDIEIALSLQKDKEKKMAESTAEEVPNPIDTNYRLLNCQLELLDKKSKEFEVIEIYTKMTGIEGFTPPIKQVWRVDRDDEKYRFKAHDKLSNRKLLWHGTDVSVVAAILKSGLRIMPHSGGRVGSGIYFASENGKSADYVCPADTYDMGVVGIMFLNEVALGKEKHVLIGESDLKAAPSGYNSVIAVGQTEPDPKKNTVLKLDGKDVIVPQGKPIENPEGKDSNFSQSEYLVYKESQNRIRYLLLMDFNGRR